MKQKRELEKMQQCGNKSICQFGILRKLDDPKTRRVFIDYQQSTKNSPKSYGLKSSRASKRKLSPGTKTEAKHRVQKVAFTKSKNSYSKNVL